MVVRERLPNTLHHKSFRQRLTPYLFLLPHLLPFLIFFLIPAVVGIYAAFTDWKLAKAPVWEGLANFKTLLFDKDSMFYYQLRWGMTTTFQFVLYTVPFQIVVPLLLAVGLNTKFKGSRVFQSLLYLPALLSIGVVMTSWNYMFDANAGLVNYFLGNIFGLAKVKWMVDVPMNWIALVIITVWWCAGSNMIIYQSALANIPSTLYEAASVDGANAWRRFWHITLPSMRYPIMYTAITGVIQQFNIYGQPLMFNYDGKGGPVVAMINGFEKRSTKVMLMYIYALGFGSSGGDPGMASAMALIMGLIIFAVSLVQFRLMRGKE